MNKVRIGQKKSPFRGGGRPRWIFGTAYAMIASSITREESTSEYREEVLCAL
mgnify:CR=1 FL=1